MFHKVCRWYLVLVPFLVAAGGFALPEMSAFTYVPIWIINGVLMVVAARSLAVGSISTNSGKPIAPTWGPALLIAPWILIAIFFGFGPPPPTVDGWVEKLGQQQIRYAILLVSAILVPSGFVLLTQRLKVNGEKVYSLLGQTAVLLAAPLFILNMIYWGAFLGEAFQLFSDNATETRPDWYPPIRAFFEWIATTEVALLYIATAAYATALKKASLFHPLASAFYVGFSLVGFLLTVTGGFTKGALAEAAFFVSIPAIPLIMPYLMGVNLIYKKPPGRERTNAALHVLRS